METGAELEETGKELESSVPSKAGWPAVRHGADERAVSPTNASREAGPSPWASTRLRRGRVPGPGGARRPAGLDISSWSTQAGGREPAASQALGGDIAAAMAASEGAALGPREPLSDWGVHFSIPENISPAQPSDTEGLGCPGTALEGSALGGPTAQEGAPGTDSPFPYEE